MKYDIVIFVVIAVLIGGVSIYGLNSQNIATYNGPSLQTYNYNISEVTSMNLPCPYFQIAKKIL